MEQAARVLRMISTIVSICTGIGTALGTPFLSPLTVDVMWRVFALSTAIFIAVSWRSQHRRDMAMDKRTMAQMDAMNVALKPLKRRLVWSNPPGLTFHVVDIDP